MFAKAILKAARTAGVLAMGASSAQADAHGEITVAYFLEWPMPFQYAKAKGMYDAALGIEINWISFDTGTQMSAAMASGDVQIALSQGIPPFVVAAAAGQDIQVLDVAVSYADNDNCVVSNALEIDADTVGDLAGKTVAVPLGTAAHYGFLRQMDHFGIDIDTLEIVNMAPADGAVALAQGAVDMACGWGGALRRMTEHGHVLLTGAEKTALGILVFDATTAPAGFVAENPDLVAQFLAVTADANAMWKAGDNASEMLDVIAAEAGMDLDAAAESLATFVFPSIPEQLSPAWLGGAAAPFMSGVADVFASNGSVTDVAVDFGATINLGPLTVANEM